MNNLSSGAIEFRITCTRITNATVVNTAIAIALYTVNKMDKEVTLTRGIMSELNEIHSFDVDAAINIYNILNKIEKRKDNTYPQINKLFGIFSIEYSIGNDLTDHDIFSVIHVHGDEINKLLPSAYTLIKSITESL